jgi:hypothetical protein
MKPTQKKLSNLRVKQQALYIMIFSFVTVVIWITGSLFRSQKKTGISPDLLELAKPLSPTINVDVIDSIEDRKVYSDQELFEFQIYKIIKSRDGRTEQVVPIDSNLEEIPDDEIIVIIQEDNQLDSGEGTFSPEQEQPTADPQTSAPSDDIPVIPPNSPGFGEDGRFYLD